MKYLLIKAKVLCRYFILKLEIPKPYNYIIMIVFVYDSNSSCRILKLYITPNLMNCYLLNDTSVLDKDSSVIFTWFTFIWFRYFYDSEMWVKVNPLVQIDSKAVPFFIAFSWNPCFFCAWIYWNRCSFLYSRNSIEPTIWFRSMNQLSKRGLCNLVKNSLLPSTTGNTFSK